MMQVLDRWSAQVRVHNVKRDQQQVGEVVEEVELAMGYVREAKKCKLLFSSLHETTAQREEPTPMNRLVANCRHVIQIEISYLTIVDCWILPDLYFSATWKTFARVCRSSSPSTSPPASTACSPLLR